ncbi:hypothetical protein B0H13DRAFT_2540912 [Mycena leptocephala]|nr:hypothetical protein B0H13DRAFT_2540912 [Mycena leptocephala]
MAPMSPVASSVSDGGKTKKKSSPSKLKEESEVEDSEAQQSGADDGEDDEEEYEIEAILDAGRGRFPKNKLGYLVKWKGYGPDQNSWVMEDDAGNAAKLIKAYWKNKKSAEPASTASKRSRMSIVDDASDAGESASVAKKRGRKSPKDHRKEKCHFCRAYRIRGAPPEEETIGNMAEHMHAPTWDQLIKNIDTVERVDDTLYVYFTLHGGERIREDSLICADKFPKMLIKFYESNLRWKEADHH